jgi:Cu(I)/Ag(I) efflux system membrane fusion protein/cobalt-zinc-cadmium efflux system membrane fusion protein
MRRVLYILAAVAIVLALVAAVVYTARARGDRVAAAAGGAPASQSMPGMTSDDTQPHGVGSTGTPRGPITIDPRRQQLIGVRTVPVAHELMQQTVRTVGVVRYDETRQADINLRVEGWIRDLYVDYTGQPIQKGQPLFTLYSPDLLTTQQEYLLALKTRDQVQGSVIAEARERADQLVTAARQRLSLWDLPPDEIRTLEEKRQALEVVVFRSPVSGFVIEKQALRGLHIMPGQTLYRVADLSVVWVEADVYERELSALRSGAAATITVDAYPGDHFTGRVIFVYPYLDERTRTNKVRFEFANRGGRLKPGMYANVELRGTDGMALTVPLDAVLDSGQEQVVFVAKGDGMFEPRTVKVGRRGANSVEILEGLEHGERVATGATFFLDSESQLRASLQGYEPTPASAGAAPATGTQITFRTQPDPPKTGENQLEVTVKDASGKSIDDAEVSVQFFMPAMPTMAMPSMRSEAKLTPAGGGVYRGTGQVMMAGRWETTVTVTRGGQRLGTKQQQVVAQ